ncbi:NAD(P)/FAD-dependent oxidoreductase [Halanaeroarchaeum sp. HSR-CO]|uniref:NAD(P)/FAD-dependent oxidoreductase n=1 Tax=Halanaeroarchaeum sp. HSR-CO TaxID=2866382 RepID=UPI00217F032A|nr:FAD-dependent oxidoreductase [Halanaeroarchaeum sp. HSR-CO]
MTEPQYDVAIVGGGVAGRSASIFTARHDLETIVLDAGAPLLRRNAHLENYPGFPAGVNARLLLDSMADQAERAGATLREATVTDLRETEDGFAIETAAGEEFRARRAIAATKTETGYLSGIEGVEIVERGKSFVAVDERGRTGVEGLYAAGRLAGKPHQTVVAAGHGAEVAVTLLEAADVPFYHDWVAPEGYFTGRGRDVPPGVEEIDDSERLDRERESLEWMAEASREPHSETPDQHPSVEN